MARVIFLLLLVFTANCTAQSQVPNARKKPWSIREAYYMLNPGRFSSADKLKGKNAPLLIISADSFLKSIDEIKKLKKLNPSARVIVYFCPNGLKDPHHPKATKGVYRTEPFKKKIYDAVHANTQWILGDLDKPDAYLYTWFDPPMYLTNTSSQCPKANGVTYNEFFVKIAYDTFFASTKCSGLADGIFIDCLWPVLSNYTYDPDKFFGLHVDFNGDGKKNDAKSTQQMDDFWREGNEELIRLFRKKLGKDKIIIGNHVNLSFGKHINPGGKMLEGFPGREFQGDWLKTMLHHWALPKMGMHYNVMMIKDFGNKVTNANISYFALGSYLLTDGTYLCPWQNKIGWYYLSGKEMHGLFLTDHVASSLDELNTKLGKPLASHENPHHVVLNETFDTGNTTDPMMLGKACELKAGQVLTYPMQTIDGTYALSFKHRMKNIDWLKFEFRNQEGTVASCLVPNRWHVSYYVKRLRLPAGVTQLLITAGGSGMVVLDDVHVMHIGKGRWKRMHCFVTKKDSMHQLRTTPQVTKRLSFFPGRYSLVFSSQSAGTLSVRFYNSKGRVVALKKVTAKKGVNRLTVEAQFPALYAGIEHDPAMTCSFKGFYKWLPSLWTRDFEGGRVYVNPSRYPVKTFLGEVVPSRSARIRLYR